MKHPLYDCIIVGAGPAGLLSGYKLAKNGLKVLILEAEPDFRRKICGEYLCPQGVGLLLSEGFSDIVDKFEPLYGMKLFSPLGKIVDTYFPKNKNIQSGLSLNREVFERALFEKVKKAGCPVHFNERLQTAFIKNGFVNLSTDKAEYKCRYLIGADGRQSKVSKLFNLDLPTSEKRIAVHTYYKPLKVQKRLGQMHIFDNGSYIGIDPIHDKEINLSLVCNAQELKDKKSQIHLLNEYIMKSDYLKNEIGLLKPEDKVWTIYPIQHHVKMAGGNLFALIGDAGGFIDPLTGEGIYNALLTAKILSDEIIIQNQKNIFDYSKVTTNYMHKRKKIMSEKIMLNRIFQAVIRRPLLVEWIAHFLLKSKNRADSFIGIIGNIYRPFEGILKMLT